MKKMVLSALILAVMIPAMVFAAGVQEGAINPEVLQVQLIPSRDSAYLDAQRLPMQQLLEAELGRKVNVTVAKIGRASCMETV